jgi:hypothetical protein
MSNETVKIRIREAIDKNWENILKNMNPNRKNACLIGICGYSKESIDNRCDLTALLRRKKNVIIMHLINQLYESQPKIDYRNDIIVITECFKEIDMDV